MTHSHLLLILEPNKTDAELLELAFSKANVEDPARVLRTLEELTAYLEQSAPYNNRELFPLPRMVLIDFSDEPVPLQTLQWLCENKWLEHFPVLGIGNKAPPELIQRAFDLGISGYFEKPADLTALAEMICKLQWIDGWKSEPEDAAQVPPSHDEKVAQADSELRNKVASLESFSYTLCHDLRAPLRAILAFTEALQQDAAHKLSAIDQDYLCRIATAGTRMNRLIDDLLAYSHSSEKCPPLEKVHVDSLVAEVISYAQSCSTA